MTLAQALSKDFGGFWKFNSHCTRNVRSLWGSEPSNWSGSRILVLRWGSEGCQEEVVERAREATALASCDRTWSVGLSRSSSSLPSSSGEPRGEPPGETEGP